MSKLDPAGKPVFTIPTGVPFKPVEIDDEPRAATAKPADVIRLGSIAQTASVPIAGTAMKPPSAMTLAEKSAACIELLEANTDATGRLALFVSSRDAADAMAIIADPTVMLGSKPLQNLDGSRRQPSAGAQFVVDYAASIVDPRDPLAGGGARILGSLPDATVVPIHFNVHTVRDDARRSFGGALMLPDIQEAFRQSAALKLMADADPKKLAAPEGRTIGDSAARRHTPSRQADPSTDPDHERARLGIETRLRFEAAYSAALTPKTGHVMSSSDMDNAAWHKDVVKRAIEQRGDPSMKGWADRLAGVSVITHRGNLSITMDADRFEDVETIRKGVAANRTAGEITKRRYETDTTIDGVSHKAGSEREWSPTTLFVVNNFNAIVREAPSGQIDRGATAIPVPRWKFVTVLLDPEVILKNSRTTREPGKMLTSMDHAILGSRLRTLGLQAELAAAKTAAPKKTPAKARGDDGPGR